MRSKPKTKSVFFVGFVTIVAIIVASPAYAHFIMSGFHFTYQSHEQCVKNAADLGHPSSGGAFKGKVESWSWLVSPWGSVDCQNRVEDPLAVRNVGWRWNGSAWNLCLLSEYFYPYAHSALTIREYSNPPCGAGYYANDSDGYVWHNNQWVGGTLYTYMYTNPFYHWLPS